MLSLPAVPSWQAIHPLLVHFPIALLLVAPVFVLIGLLRKPERGFPFLAAGLILMALGTVGTFVAASSGRAAGELVEGLPKVEATLEQHEELAQVTQIVFSALTLIFAAILFVPRVLKCIPNRTISTVLPAVFLVFYAAGAVSLVNAAHQGGRLVHELGVHAQMQRDAKPAAAVSRESAERE
jgi:uncharacterized membrane protein